MKLENRCLVPADQETTWDLVMDIPRAGACVPNMREVVAKDEDHFEATMQVRVGPMALNLSGTLQVLERRPEDGVARFLIEATDRRVGGAVRAELTMELLPQPDGQTELVLVTDSTFMGRLGELGQPIIRRKANTTMQDFARNLAAQLTPS